eukprot:743501-Pleurochrysis_carterae.AAC.1
MLRRLSPEGTGDDSLVSRQMISQRLRVHMGVALSCVLSKPGRPMPPRSFDAVLVPLIEHLGACSRMGSSECFGPSAAIGAAFFQLKNELRSS